ncbi:FtsX-like permease family protein [Jiangella alba]|uniref:Putative ABC transport system permease protein n=1 Tax=Jiangella alba TaxID=561176 RepID=A0A1H5PRT0_9ACTN|nr:FtsX-like permease family protein [Jiangella alba]SEF15928.1 putative ABC transport system permease protein [Jiangella alba]
MIGLSLRGFRDRWPLFAGAVLTVAVGVALIASAAAIAASATPPDTAGLTPHEAAAVRDAFDGVATVMIISAILAGFLTVFIVATTFSFTVAERRRDLALLRLLGAGRLQVRLVLTGEAVLLGTAGAALGLPLTDPAVRTQLWLLRRAEFVPDGFVLTRPSWAGWVAAGIGIGVAVFGVAAASRRAARIPPLEAVRGAPAAASVMTAGRWAGGLAMLALTVVQIVAASFVGVIVALALGLGVAITGAVAFGLLGPALLPPVSLLLGLPVRATTLGRLAQANIRDGVQRSASTAAPVIVLVAMVLSLTGAVNATTSAVTAEQREGTDADLVVATTGEHVAVLARLPGVAAASPEQVLPLTVDLPGADRRLDGIAVIDPDAYGRVHRVRPVAGELDDLTGPAIAVMEQPTDGVRYTVGERATVTVGDTAVDVRIAVVLPERLSGQQQVLVPRDLVPADELAAAPADVLLRIAPGHDPATVARAAAAYGDVTDVDAWIAAAARDQQRTNTTTLAVLLVLAALYTVMAVVNAMVIAGTGRRREHAVARLSGLTRAQVVATTAVEALLVAATGLVLGALVVTAALAGIAVAARRSVGTAIVEVPWTLAAATVAGTLLLAAVVAPAVSLLVTRGRPVVLAAARE